MGNLSVLTRKCIGHRCWRGNPMQNVASKRELWNKLANDHVDDEQWNNWVWQLQKRITKIDTLKKVIPLSLEEEQEISAVLKHFPMSVSPYFLTHVRQLIDTGEEGKANALKRIFLPSIQEISPICKTEIVNGMGENGSTPHRFISQLYPDRALLFVTDSCPIYCRYCFRRRKIIREVGEDEKEEGILKKTNLEKAVEYIKTTVRNGEKIRDVILSGGDPLSLSDKRLDEILTGIKSIKTVEILRIDTIFPAVLPQRITDSFVSMIRKHHPLFMTIHFVHPAEITDEVKKACAKLVDAGIPLGTYTPILKGINNDKESIKMLLWGLIKMRIRPYYLVQFLPTKWTEHFRVPLMKSLSLLEGFHGGLSGIAIPTFKVYIKGKGKVPLLPQYYVKRTCEGHLLKTWSEEIALYEEPKEDDEEHSV